MQQTYAVTFPDEQQKLKTFFITLRLRRSVNIVSGRADWTVTHVNGGVRPPRMVARRECGYSGFRCKSREQRLVVPPLGGIPPKGGTTSAAVPSALHPKPEEPRNTSPNLGCECMVYLLNW